MVKANSDKHVITYEAKSRGAWAPQTISISARTRLGPILREMRAQDGMIRNVRLIQSAA